MDGRTDRWMDGVWGILMIWDVASAWSDPRFLWSGGRMEPPVSFSCLVTVSSGVSNGFFQADAEQQAIKGTLLNTDRGAVEQR